MSPDKLFDYLDGQLPHFEREQLEAQLANDEHLQRELSIARQIHKGMSRSREVILPEQLDPEDAERGGILGRRVATAFAVLVALNVVVGLIFIAARNQKKPADFGPKEAAIRKQLQESLAKTTSSAFAVPAIGPAEITLHVAKGQRDETATKIVGTAARMGGAGTKALPEEHSIIVLAEIPSNSEAEFRQMLSTLGAVASSPEPAAADSSPTASEKKMFQVRIEEPPQ
jgi:anti-sigma factor RsiW